MEFVDRLLTCSDCGGNFIFTAGEQLFFSDKQFKNDPKRCKPCKSKRDARNPGAVAKTGSTLRTETRTKCSTCGIETTVPFKPTRGKPVLCRQCFQIKQAGTDGQALSPQNPAATDLMTGISSGEHAVVTVDLVSRIPQA